MANQVATQVVTLTQYTNTTISSNAKHLTFIVGMYCTLLTDNLTVSARSVGINPAFATLQVSNGPGSYLTNITISSVIFDPNSSQFLSYAGQVTYSTFSTQVLNLYNNFLPIYYLLVGMNSIRAEGDNSRLLGYKIEMNDTVLQLGIVRSGTQYASFGFSYITIGIKTADVCGSCGNTYFYNGSCIATCPANTYAKTYTDGGKACPTCSALVGQQINDLGNGCNCLPGYEVLTDNQCVSAASVPTNCTGNNVIQNGTSCICAPGTYNMSGSCQSCPSGTFFDGTQCKATAVTCTVLNTVLDSTGSKCVCITGYTNYSGLCRPTCPANSAFSASSLQCECSPNYMNISGACLPCQSDQSYDSTTKACKCNLINQAVSSLGKCQCLDGYYNISGFCIQCPSGTVYLNGVCAPTSCQENQIVSNGKCICDTFSVKIGSVCVRCENGTFPNTDLKSCEPCMSHCLNCTSRLTCDQCELAFIFDFTSQSCISSGPRVTVAPRKGFPYYTAAAIVTDFTIASSATMGIRTSQQLSSIVVGDFKGYGPGRVILTQNPNDLNTVRVVLDYRELIPLSPFNVVYNFKEATIGLDYNLTLTYTAANANLTTVVPD